MAPFDRLRARTDVGRRGFGRTPAILASDGRLRRSFGQTSAAEPVEASGGTLRKDF